MVAITHDHTMYGLAVKRKNGEKAVFSNYYAPLFRRGGVNVIGWVVGGDPPFFGIENDGAWLGSLELLHMLWHEAEESSDTLAICLNSQDIENAVADGKIALVLTMEGAAALEEGPSPDPIANLKSLHRLGLRSLQLVGQDWNKLINSSQGHPYKSKGLSSWGKDMVREMNRLGMIIDLAHIPDPDPVFEDVIDISQHPVIDSHRGLRGVTDIARNISDERIKAIAKTGGVIGLQFFSLVLTSQADQQGTIDDLVRHIDHIVKVAGIDYVSLGPDYLEANQKNEDMEYYIRGAKEITDLPKISESLLRHGYSNENIEMIMGKNILRVYKQVMG